MAGLATIDGKTVPIERATIGVLDRGFLYGDSVFETLRTYAGTPFLLGRHLQRLERSAAIVGIDPSAPIRVFEEEVLRTLAAAANDESYVRITVTRGSGELGLDPSTSMGARRIVLVMPLKPLPGEIYQAGLRTVTVASGRMTSESPTRGAKTGNYLDRILALRRARERGAADALLVEADGRVIQGSASNIFFVEGGALVTPPVDEGILAGVTRGALIEVAEKLGIRVALRSPRVTEIGNFDEIFLSSSVRELAPVVDIDGSTVGDGRPGPVYARLLSAYRDAARRGLAPDGA